MQEKPFMRALRRNHASFSSSPSNKSSSSRPSTPSSSTWIQLRSVLFVVASSSSSSSSPVSTDRSVSHSLFSFSFASFLMISLSLPPIVHPYMCKNFAFLSGIWISKFRMILSPSISSSPFENF